MRKKIILIPMLLALVGFCWLAGPVTSAAAPSGGHSAVDVVLLEKLIHAFVNQERQRAGLPPLAWSSALQQIARGHSRDMAIRHFFSHTDPEGRNFVNRYRRAGFNCATRTGLLTISRGGENLAWNRPYRSVVRRQGKTVITWKTEEQIAAAVVQIWMESPSHRRNILTRHYRREGIGVAIGADGKVLTTQNFC